MGQIQYQSEHYLDFQIFKPEQDFFLQKVDDYLPEGMDKKLKNYMHSRHLGPKNAIPIWNPCQIQGVNIRRCVKLDVGDVGTFTKRGGFQVVFNVLMSKELNRLCDYDVPKNFSPFKFPLSPEQAKCCSVEDDGTTIKLNGCGAIIWEKMNCSGGALTFGFNKSRCKSSE